MTPILTSSCAHFRIWAPKAKSLQARLLDGPLQGTYDLKRSQSSYFEVDIPGVKPRTRYLYLLDGQPYPDPFSAFQPEGVFGPSQLIDSSCYRWNDAGWSGRPLEELILYELHVGTFTEEGTYRSATQKLPELVDLGITAVELMPLATCSGRWNWGYDGVFLWAPSPNYGAPDDLKAFVDACHAHGLAVIHDVVYNHLGPEGNVFSPFGPYLRRRGTPWGDAPNFDGRSSRPVREAFLHNAARWIREYHFDGLRFDAIAVIRDRSPRHIINEIGDHLRQIGNELGRTVLAIGETNLYQPEFLRGSGGSLDAVWSDDLTHAANATVTGRSFHGGRNYKAQLDFATALQRGYLYERNPDLSPKRAQFERPCQLERCIQQVENHDTVGNSPDGLRIHALCSISQQEALAALCFLYPTLPLIFMGEEWAANAPFHFFVDFRSPKIRRAVEKGRAREFAHHDWFDATLPTEEKAFYQSKLSRASATSEETRQWYRSLIALRKRWSAAGLLKAERLKATPDPASGRFQFSYHHDGRERASVHVNLSPEPIRIAFGKNQRLAAARRVNREEPSALELAPAGIAIVEADPLG